ncbi:Na+/H+ antiporter subunit E [Citricoccus sp. SGAir0253]|uniref:Na+/H+ antiporter subunit E n=1 Tax=Citricoccus sp. SGAir0253 TaxID=2567881 RepID=UPI0010CD38ED|nr:Na+/H+ antiporter subunit E [Citricoccus sp. SGAir0253]QCU77279.1 Na+/H+ antiporter subunit E [Citricoccus sp. SGAir0253]
MSTRTEGPAGRAGNGRDTGAEGRQPFWSQWPLLLGLTLTWGALWQDFSPGVLLAGVVFSLLVLWFYRLPRVTFADRFSPWHVLVFTGRFLVHVVTASASVAWDAITKGPRIANSVVAVPLRSHDDLVVTLTGHALALVPGSLVIDVDRPSSTLFLHVLDARDEADVESFRAEALATEAAIIRAIGSRADLALVEEDEARRADRRADRGGKETR